MVKQNKDCLVCNLEKGDNIIVRLLILESDGITLLNRNYTLSPDMNLIGYIGWSDKKEKFFLVVKGEAIENNPKVFKLCKKIALTWIDSFAYYLGLEPEVK